MLRLSGCPKALANLIRKKQFVVLKNSPANLARLFLKYLNSPTAV